MTRLISWNIRHGGGARTEAIAEAIAGHRPDVAVLAEFRHNRFGARLHERLADMGLVHRRSGWAPPPTNTVSVASRYPLTPLPRTGCPGDWSHRVVAARCGDFRLVGLHLPNLKAKLPLLEYLIALPRAWRREPSLLVGDLNAGKQGIDGPDTFVFFEGAYLEKLESQGWTDGFRHFHGLERDFTWYSHRRNGYRLDYAMSSPPMTGLLRGVRHSHREREAGLSDHSILIVDFRQADA